MLLLQLNENDQNTKSSILTFKQASSNIFHLPGVKCTFIILTFKKVARQNYICIIKSPGQITFDCKDYLKNAFGYIHFYRVLVFCVLRSTCTLSHQLFVATKSISIVKFVAGHLIHFQHNCKLHFQTDITIDIPYYNDPLVFKMVNCNIVIILKSIIATNVRWLSVRHTKEG